MPDLLIYICRKCCHILDLACDFKNMCIKSNRLLRGYATQLKSASNTVENIRNELFMMFNSDKHVSHHQDGGKLNQHQVTQMPSIQQSQQQQQSQQSQQPQHKPDAGPSNNKIQTGVVYARQPPQPQPQQKPDTRDELRHHSMIEKVKQETAEDLVNNYNARLKQPQQMLQHGKHQIADKTEKVISQVNENVMTCFDIKSEFVNELATCSNPVEAMIHTSDSFNFEIKPAGQHQCSLCHKCFSRESVLTRHMLIHSGERPHHCNVCNKNFTHKFNLKQHMLIHSGHKTHHCTVCDKGFIKKSDLDRHMLTHFGERIHHCSICGKSFVRKENLNQHILTHTGQKPHHCTQCTKSFLRKSDLNRHMLLCISKRS